MNAEQLALRIYRREKFTVEIDYDGNDLKGYPPPCKNNRSVATWKNKLCSFYNSKLTVNQITVFKGNGDIANGNLHLINLRNTYNLSILRTEINGLKATVEYLNSQLLGINENNIQNNTLNDNCAILGITADDLTLECVTDAYRRRVRIFAPDTIQYLVDTHGLHSEYLIYATRKAAEINVAYKQLKKECEQQQKKEKD